MVPTIHAEVVPPDQVDLDPEELLWPVCHYSLSHQYVRPKPRIGHPEGYLHARCLGQTAQAVVSRPGKLVAQPEELLWPVCHYSLSHQYVRPKNCIGDPEGWLHVRCLGQTAKAVVPRTEYRVARVSLRRSRSRSCYGLHACVPTRSPDLQANQPTRGFPPSKFWMVGDMGQAHIPYAVAGDEPGDCSAECATAKSTHRPCLCRTAGHETLLPSD